MKNFIEISEPQVQPKGSRETRPRASLVHGFAVALAAGLLFSAVSSVEADIGTWKGASADGGNGDWITTGNWTAFPSTSGTAMFLRNATYTSPSSTVTVTGTSTISSLLVSQGKTVQFNFEKDSIISATGITGQNSSGQINIGGIAGTGTGGSNVTFSGPQTGGTASINFAQLHVANGSTVTFEHSLTGILAGANNSRGSVIGGASGGNVVNVLDGAKINVAYHAYFGQAFSGNSYAVASNNTILVSGSGSQLSIAQGMNIASGASDAALVDKGLTSWNDSRTGNALKIENGGTFTSTILRLGESALSRSNYVLVSGSGSYLKTTSTVSIGISNGLGGNYIAVENGGIYERTAGTFTIGDFNKNGGYNDGANRLTIGAGGTYTAATSSTNYGLMQLAASGTINGAGSIHVESGGRFEVAGSGLLVTTGTSIIKDGGTLAVGLTPTSGSGSASVMTVASKVRLETGSTLELGLFGANLADRLDISNTGVFTVDSGISIALALEGYTPVGGETWTLLVNNSGSATRFTSTSIANFEAADFGVLPTLAPHLSWDMSAFNEAGGWQVSIAIPEPSSIALLGFGLAGSGLLLRKRKRG